MTILHVEHLSKKFGAKQVIDDISFSLEEGKIFGLLGQNGAGKTTLMKMILGLMPVSSGTIYVQQEKVVYGDTPTNRFVGYLPDVPAFYPYMTASEYLMLCAEITGIPRLEAKERTERYLSLVGLENNKKRIGAYSRGMKQRLGIAQALIHQPKLLICDEPTSALDPVGRQEIMQILKSIKKETTVLFSTHILNDAEQICDEVAILHNGKFVIKGATKEIIDSHKNRVIEVGFQDEVSAARFKERVEGDLVDSSLFITTDSVDETQKKVFGLLAEGDFHPNTVHIVKPSLEDIFMEVIR